MAGDRTQIRTRYLLNTHHKRGLLNQLSRRGNKTKKQHLVPRGDKDP
jgi:hypothetical protein